MGSHDFLWYLAILSCRSLGLACLTWLALRMCQVKSASVRHAVWTVVTAVMLLQVVVTPALPRVSLRVLAPVPDAGPTPQLALGQVPVQLSDSHGPARRLPSWRQVVIWVYVAITTVLLFRLIFGYFSTRTLVRNSRRLDWPRVRESESISVPMTVGQISPTILLPVAWREWDPVKLRAVLAHEEAHVRRADWAIGVMARVNCCVFWFHPLSWWLKRELALLAEYACDDSVLARIGDRREYARALLEIAYAMKSAHGRLLENAVPMAKETNVEKRMEQILDDTRRIPPAFGRRGWVALLMCSLPVAYLASAVQLAPAQTKIAVPAVDEISHSPEQENVPVLIERAKKAPVQIVAQARPVVPPPNPTPPPTASPFKKWLDEEVAYIISEEERRAFIRLRTDDEHEAFIEQFWLRRDPTPNTPENEMREEHYRRIAFANDRFSVGIPGWKTDRGMIYIKYGPPEAIDSHGATPATYPYETWRYPDVTGLGTAAEFEFVDPTMTGRYHLTNDPSEKERQH
jgi:GWxTD domain-containing protein